MLNEGAVGIQATPTFRAPTEKQKRKGMITYHAPISNRRRPSSTSRKTAEIPEKKRRSKAPSAAKMWNIGFLSPMRKNIPWKLTGFVRCGSHQNVSKLQSPGCPAALIKLCECAETASHGGIPSPRFSGTQIFEGARRRHI